MGYFGLPSKACSPCRSRRIKCDLSTPACGQCVRSHRTCFGYRNPVDLLFHDQSEDVACKAQRPKRKSQRKPVTSTVVTKCSNAALPMPMFVPLSAENQAFCFFFNNYPSKSCKSYKTIYEFIPTLYCSESSDSPLVCIVTALGLAGLSHHTEASGLGVAASAWYDKALCKVNFNLRHVELAKIDQTLLVVLLLGIYETNTCRTPGYQSAEAALTHVKGATALLNLRGEKQLDSEIGRALFIQARTQIVSGCYQTRSPLPDIVVQLSRKCHDTTIDPLGEIILSISRFCNMKAELPFCPPASQSEITTRAAVARYLAIAQKVTDWRESSPAAFLPTTVSTVGINSDVLSEHYYVYENIWVAAFANNLRANCILIHEALISQLCFLQTNYAHDLNEVLEIEDKIMFSRRLIISCIDQVCASVPDLLKSGYAAAGVGLLWVLFLVAQISPKVAPLPTTTRSWIIGRLEKIGTEMGVQQANTLAKLLRETFEVPDSLNDGLVGV